jgi:hypothetical protein
MAIETSKANGAPASAADAAQSIAAPLRSRSISVTFYLQQQERYREIAVVVFSTLPSMLTIPRSMPTP